MVWNYDRMDVMSYCKSFQWIGLMYYYILSTVVCGVCYRSGYIHLVRKLSWSLERGTRLAMPKTNLHAGLLVIEARFRGY